jgi:hypothetical protein
VTGPAAIRVLAASQGVAGLVLLVRPGDVLDALAPAPAHPPHWLVRLLGARVVIQQAVVAAAPSRRLVLAGVAVDGLHAASMVAAALVWPRQRRAATVSALSATASAVLGWVTAPAAPHPLR